MCHERAIDYENTDCTPFKEDLRIALVLPVAINVIVYAFMMIDRSGFRGRRIMNCARS